METGSGGFRWLKVRKRERSLFLPHASFSLPLADVAATQSENRLPHSRDAEGCVRPLWLCVPPGDFRMTVARDVAGPTVILPTGGVDSSGAENPA